MLEAGKGTRLFPLTEEIPKPMAPVVNTPIIEHIFDLLRAASYSLARVWARGHTLRTALSATATTSGRARRYGAAP